MSAKKWWVLGTLVAGFVWPGFWILSLIIFEFGIRRGMDVAVFWVEGRFGGGRGRGGGNGYH